jgi:hypothetical protein
MSSIRDKTPKWVWKQVAIKKKRAKILEGMLCTDNKYGPFEVIKYHNASKVIIRMIEEDRVVMVHLSTVLNKSVKTSYTPYVQGVGYKGEGRYQLMTSVGNIWKRRLSSLPKKYHNFQVFAKDYYNDRLDLEENDNAKT